MNRATALTSLLPDRVPTPVAMTSRAATATAAWSRPREAIMYSATIGAIISGPSYTLRT